MPGDKTEHFSYTGNIKGLSRSESRELCGVSERAYERLLRAALLSLLGSVFETRTPDCF